ncbi:unnamed protein product [Euphydryas editha]|uniref:Uncharacterized protein n=1 Tax=Euphydryas editha TaxID=104508 RepID=A0AAU9U304_EUPED|nr:unnamed protein product [Euphydryas editha]
MRFDCSNNNNCTDIFVHYLPNFISKIIFSCKTVTNTIEVDNISVQAELKTNNVYVQTDDLRYPNHLEDLTSVPDEIVENNVNKNMTQDLIRAKHDVIENVEEKNLHNIDVDNEEVRHNIKNNLSIYIYLTKF